MDDDSASERRVGEVTVRILRRTCIASANCMKVAPELFAFDQERVCAFVEPLPALDAETVVEACRVCPVDALEAISRSGERLVP